LGGTPVGVATAGCIVQAMSTCKPASIGGMIVFRINYFSRQQFDVRFQG